MPDPAPPTPVARFESLDALRFLAAVAVLLSHARAMWPVAALDGAMESGLLHPKSAVTFFFVLSGFVLHLSWKGAWPRWQSYGSFITRRMFRIYPLYFVSLLLAALVLGLLPLAECPAFTQDAGGSEVLPQDRTNAVQWLHHLLLITPGLDMQFLNPPIWTLTAEMRVAIIFPWLSWLATWAGWWRGLALLPLLFAVGPWLGQKTLPTVALIPLFFLGAWVAEHRVRLLPARAWAWVMLSIGVVVYAASAELRGRDFSSQTWQTYVAGGGSALIILAVLAWPGLRAWLERRVMVTGGQASYGVYVLHFPLLMALAYLTWVWGLPAWLFQVSAVALTVLIAVPIYRCFEVPMMGLGRRMACALFNKSS